MAVPIFVISFNRGHFLRRVIDSYRCQSLDVDVTVVDFGSDDEETLEIIDDLCRQHDCRLFRLNKINTADELNTVNVAVSDYFSHTSRDCSYVVTDCDIDLSMTHRDALSVYSELLGMFDSAECVGPMLKISDIPRSNPLYNRIMNRQIVQFWRREPQWIDHRRQSIALLPAVFDTTFALHRSGTPFRRLKRGLRVYWPYEAQHLDWYYDSEDAHQTTYSRTASSGISHWNGSEQLDMWRHESLKFDHYTNVQPGASGAPEAMRVLLT